MIHRSNVLTSTMLEAGLAVPQLQVLVVDGQPDLLAALPNSVPGWNLRIATAQGVEAALEQLRQGSFELIVADIDHPDAGDVALAKALRHAAAGARLLIVGSGRDLNVTLDLLRQGIFLLLLRPLLSQRLADALEHAASAKNWQQDIEILSATPQWVQLRVRCRFEAADRAVQLLREIPGALTPEQNEELATGLREILMNAIEHGAQLDERKVLDVISVVTQRAVCCYVRDPGPGFSFVGLTHAAIANEEGKLDHAGVRQQKGIRPGGFGILMAKNLVDELIYSERGNEVLLVKNRT